MTEEKNDLSVYIGVFVVLVLIAIGVFVFVNSQKPKSSDTDKTAQTETTNDNNTSSDTEETEQETEEETNTTEQETETETEAETEEETEEESEEEETETEDTGEYTNLAITLYEYSVPDGKTMQFKLSTTKVDPSLDAKVTTSLDGSDFKVKIENVTNDKMIPWIINKYGGCEVTLVEKWASLKDCTYENNTSTYIFTLVEGREGDVVQDDTSITVKIW